HLPDLFDASYRQILTYRGYYRPLPLLMLGLEQVAGDGGALWSHLDAVLLHALNSVLIAALATVIAPSLAGISERPWRAGLLCGLLYACHPVLIESVAWISSRFDLLLTTFALCLLLVD